MAEGNTAGKPGSGLDMIIVAVAGANERVVVTNKRKGPRRTQGRQSDTRGDLMQRRGTEWSGGLAGSFSQI